MAQVNRTVLKSYFETGDKPTEGQFIDLIDSLTLVSQLGDATLSSAAKNPTAPDVNKVLGVTSAGNYGLVSQSGGGGGGNDFSIGSGLTLDTASSPDILNWGGAVTEDTIITGAGTYALDFGDSGSSPFTTVDMYANSQFYFEVDDATNVLTHQLSAGDARVYSEAQGATYTASMSLRATGYTTFDDGFTYIVERTVTPTTGGSPDTVVIDVRDEGNFQVVDLQGVENTLNITINGAQNGGGGRICFIGGTTNITNVNWTNVDWGDGDEPDLAGLGNNKELIVGWDQSNGTIKGYINEIIYS